MLPAQDDEAGLKVEAQNVSRGFQELRDEVMGQYGYQSSRSRRSSGGSGGGSQELFASKTRKQCDSESRLMLNTDLNFQYLIFPRSLQHFMSANHDSRHNNTRTKV